MSEWITLMVVEISFSYYPSFLLPEQAVDAVCKQTNSNHQWVCRKITKLLTTLSSFHLKLSIWYVSTTFTLHLHFQTGLRMFPVLLLLKLHFSLKMWSELCSDRIVDWRMLFYQNTSRGTQVVIIYYLFYLTRLEGLRTEDVTTAELVNPCKTICQILGSKYNKVQLEQETCWSQLKCTN